MAAGFTWVPSPSRGAAGTALTDDRHVSTAYTESSLQLSWCASCSHEMLLLLGWDMCFLCKGLSTTRPLKLCQRTGRSILNCYANFLCFQGDSHITLPSFTRQACRIVSFQMHLVGVMALRTERVGQSCASLTWALLETKNCHKLSLQTLATLVMKKVNKPCCVIKGTVLNMKRLKCGEENVSAHLGGEVQLFFGAAGIQSTS